jgi:beta-glucosidase
MSGRSGGPGRACRRFGVAVLASSMLWLGAAQGQPNLNPTAPASIPWSNTALSADQRADLVLAQMTQDEKFLLLKGYFGADLKLPFLKSTPAAIRPLLKGTAGYVPGIPRLGIPALVETDAGVGIANHLHMRDGDEATALPSGLMLAAAWNPDLAFADGAVIGSEARARGFNVVLDGAINLAREPRGGRTFEYAGEDPLLAGMTIGSQVSGVQSRHVVSTVKHFALNDQETGRAALSANIDESAARESDLLAFEIAIERGDPGAVMCAYNRYGSTYACENDFLLNQVLKRDWNYHGWVLSDWGAVHGSASSANAGLDQESAAVFDGMEYFDAPLRQALAEGKVEQSRIDDMVRRILRSMFAHGLMDLAIAKEPANVEADRLAAQHVAEEGIVLLKNTGGALPLSRAARSIVVIGAHADLGILSGGGSSQVIPTGYAKSMEFPTGGAVQTLPNGARMMPMDSHVYDPPSPLAAIAAAAPQAHVTFVSGEDAQAAAKAAQQADIVLVFAQQWMSEGSDLSSLSLPGAQDTLIEAVAAANPHTIVVLETGGPVLMPWLDKVPAVLEAWYAGSGGSVAIARVLFGEVNPSGKLPITFPMSESQLPRPAIPGLGLVRTQFDVDYLEGADVGYRWFERQNATPLFPFGYGLSYSTFLVTGVTATGGPTVTVDADVKNDGAVGGKETVQVYATPPDTSGKSVARLIGWSKIDLAPGETRHIQITGEPRLLAAFDKDRHVWHIAEGDYAVSVGTSSASVSATVHVALPARDIAP